MIITGFKQYTSWNGRIRSWTVFMNILSRLKGRPIKTPSGYIATMVVKKLTKYIISELTSSLGMIHIDEKLL